MTDTQSEKAAQRAEVSSSLIEPAAGIAVVVLAILGLAGVSEPLLMSIALVILGAAIIAQGSGVAGEFSRLLSGSSGGSLQVTDLGSTMTAGILTGLVVLVLGILALVGQAPEVLVPAAVIVVGAGLILGASSTNQLNELKVANSGANEVAQRVARAAGSGATGAQILVGLAAVVLGILALASPLEAEVLRSDGATSTLLTLVALLAVGAAITVSSNALTGRLFRSFGA